MSSLIKISENDYNSKRVNISGWKAGKTVETKTILKLDPSVIDWYCNFANDMSTLLNIETPLQPTSFDMPTSCALLIYNDEGDFINWHFDQNHFNGRFFTVLIPITSELTNTEYLYRDANGDTKQINQQGGSIIFEGEKVFHMASKLGKNQRRVVLSLQYVTDDSINILNSFLMKIKDIAYTGLF